ncbi:MAG: hypothetical protein R3325_05920 [Thermoanaerobaculia bacterium]|nr:hypothetical protein [Thermoanaerobaculia bacterium]
MTNRPLRTALLLAVLGLVPWVRAEAYVDPATGSYVLQMILAGLLGALFTLKLFWRRLVGALSTLFRRSPRADRDEA